MSGVWNRVREVKNYPKSGYEVWSVSVWFRPSVSAKWHLSEVKLLPSLRGQTGRWRPHFFLVIGYISKEWFSGPPLLSCRSHVYISERQEGFTVVSFARKRRSGAYGPVLAGANGKFFWQPWAFPGRNSEGSGSHQGRGFRLLETMLEFGHVSNCRDLDGVLCAKSFYASHQLQDFLFIFCF